MTKHWWNISSAYYFCILSYPTWVYLSWNGFDGQNWTDNMTHHDKHTPLPYPYKRGFITGSLHWKSTHAFDGNVRWVNDNRTEFLSPVWIQHIYIYPYMRNKFIRGIASTEFIWWHVWKKACRRVKWFIRINTVIIGSCKSIKLSTINNCLQYFHVSTFPSINCDINKRIP